MRRVSEARKGWHHLEEAKVAKSEHTGVERALVLAARPFQRRKVTAAERPDIPRKEGAVSRVDSVEAQ